MAKWRHMQPTYPKNGPQRFIFPKDVVKVPIGYVRFDKIVKEDKSEKSQEYHVVLMNYSDDDLNANPVKAVMEAKVDNLSLWIRVTAYAEDTDDEPGPPEWSLMSGPTSVISAHKTFSEAAVAVTKLTLMDWLVVDKEESAEP